MPIIILFSSVLSILNLIIWDYYIKGYIYEQSTAGYLRFTDYVEKIFKFLPLDSCCKLFY